MFYLPLRHFFWKQLEWQLHSLFAGLQKQHMSGGLWCWALSEALWPPTGGVRGSCSSGGRSSTCILSVSWWGLSFVFSWATSLSELGQQPELRLIFSNISAWNADIHCRHREFLMWWWVEGCWGLILFHWTAVTLISCVAFWLPSPVRTLFLFHEIHCSRSVTQGMCESDMC